MKSPLPGPFRTLENFGHSLKTPSFLVRPKAIEEIASACEFALANDYTIALRGAGRSYNDAALNGGGILLDLQPMNAILAWDAETGLITVQPGVTLGQLWQSVLPFGWWPPVVSGTMTTTLGGCLAANIHGKNNFRLGTIGEHVTEFQSLLTTGAEITCSPKKNGDLFRAMIGGMGLLGIFTSITLQMRRIHSGLLNVNAWNVPNLAEHLAALTSQASAHNYTVGWLDPIARGKHLGRGQMHTADYLAEGEDPAPSQTMRVDFQTLPDRFFGLVPKAVLHYFMAPFMNNPGAWAVNTAKYLSGARQKTMRQPHAAFHFLLDYVPDWEQSYGQLIQYQTFLPKETALQAWNTMLAISQQRSLPSYLGVTKRHRPDDFLLSYSVDGFSLALDFKVTASNRKPLARMLAEFDQITLEAEGRFYFAKNSETSAATARAFLGPETIARFRQLKKRCDPAGLLQSDLYRRIFAETA